MAAAQPTYPYQIGAVPPAQPTAQGVAQNAYAAQYAAQYAQYAQYAAQYQQYAAAVAAQQTAAAAAAQQQQQPQPAHQPAHQPAPVVQTPQPKTITEVTPAHSESSSNKQYQPHTVQVSGLDRTKVPNIKELTDKFGTVGSIKTNKYGQASVKCKPDDGIVTIEYESASSVESAIKWFNDSNFDGSKIRVEPVPHNSPYVTSVKQAPEPQPASQPPPMPHYPPHMMPNHPPPYGFGPPPPHFGHPPPMGPGMVPPRPNVPPRPGDWDCIHCGNSNFQFREECRRCKTKRDNADKSKVPPDEASKRPHFRPNFRPPFVAPGFPPRGPHFMRGGPHPGMRPFFGGPPRPYMGHRPRYNTGSKRKYGHSDSSQSAKEIKTDAKK